MYNIVQKQLISSTEQNAYTVPSRNMIKTLCVTACVRDQDSVAKPLRSTKRKSTHNNQQYFVDIKQVKDEQRASVYDV